MASIGQIARRLARMGMGVSLVLCLGSLALWVRSFRTGDLVMWQRRDGARWIRSAPGHVVIAFDLADWSNQAPNSYGLKYTRTTPPDPADAEMWMMSVLSVSARDRWESWNWSGFIWTRWKAAAGGSSTGSLALPMWAIIVLTATPPLWWLWRSVKVRRSRRAGGCLSCGYSLTGNISGTCPECGTPTAEAMKAL